MILLGPLLISLVSLLAEALQMIGEPNSITGRWRYDTRQLLTEAQAVLGGLHDGADGATVEERQLVSRLGNQLAMAAGLLGGVPGSVWDRQAEEQAERFLKSAEPLLERCAEFLAAIPPVTEPFRIVATETATGKEWEIGSMNGFEYYRTSLDFLHAGSFEVRRCRMVVGNRSSMRLRVEPLPSSYTAQHTKREGASYG